MLPFSIFRTWFLGVFSWALLGLGIYLAYRCYEEFNRPRESSIRPPAEQRDRDQSPERVEHNRTTGQDREQSAWYPWALLAGAVSCFGVSLGGYWPASWLLANSQGVEATALEPHQTLQVGRPDGTCLHVQIFGFNSGPTLLLTHGWSLDQSAWDYVKGELASRFRVVTWDLAGLGQSTQPANGDFSLEKMAGDLESVLKVAAPTGSVVLVGHSIGGMIQQTFCRLYPEHVGKSVEGMVLIHTTYTDPARTCLGSGLMTALEVPLIIPLNYVTIWLAPLAWLSNWQSYLNGSLHVSSRIESFSDKQTWQQLDHAARLAAGAWPANVARGNLAMLAFDEQATLPNVDLPVLVIAGKEDILTLPSASEYLDQQLPASRLYSIDSAHLGHWELGDQVAQALQEFALQVLSEPKESANEAKERNRAARG